jgi:hypothetical protein
VIAGLQIGLTAVRSRKRSPLTDRALLAYVASARVNELRDFYGVLGTLSDGPENAHLKIF